MKTAALALLVVTLGTSLSAEELLVSPSKTEYLGWKKSEAKFKTCPGAYMKILEGYKVNPIPNRCIGSHFTLSGILEDVDLLIHSFTFRSNGDRLTFFVLKETSGGLHELPRPETFVDVLVDAKKITVSWNVDNAQRSAVFEKALDPEDKIPSPKELGKN
ncbi:MAG: hypothetical protein WB973_13945 [Thermoanaerobaculia bacterium]